jgi:hypothetical protein
MFRHLSIFTAAALATASLNAQEPAANPTPETAPAAPVETSATPAPETIPAGPAPSDLTPTEQPAPAETAPVDNPATGNAAPAAPGEDVIPLSGETAPAAPTEPAQEEPAPADVNLPDQSFTDPNAIVPDTTVQPPIDVPSGGGSKEEIDRYFHIRYKQIRTIADNEPQIAAMLAKTVSARTEEDKRAAFRVYYRMLFARMLALDLKTEPSFKTALDQEMLHKDFKERCDVREAAYQRRLAQIRIEPTIPLNPPPTPEPLGRN